MLIKHLFAARSTRMNERKERARCPHCRHLLLLFIFVLGAIIALVRLSAITLVFDKLGLSPDSALLLLLASILGSFYGIFTIGLIAVLLT